MVIEFINLKELFECLVLVINFNVIKERDTTWILYDSLHDWLIQLRFIAMVYSALIARAWVGPQTH